LHRKTLYMLSRKGRFIHQEPKKNWICIFLIFLWFLMNFLRFNWNPNVHLHRNPWLKFQNHTNTHGFQNKPWKFLASCNVVPGRACSSPAVEFPSGDGRTWPEEVPGVPRALTVDGKNSFNISIGLASVQVTYALLHLREIPRFVNPRSKEIASA
jgi:hypothetical protein